MNQPAFKHQDFSIDKAVRNKVVRQDRFFPNSSDHFILIESGKFRVENYAAFGIAVKDFDQPNISKTKCLYLVDEIEICDLDLNYVRYDIATGLTIFSLENQPLPIEAILAIELAKENISEFEKDLQKHESIPSGFRQSTNEFKGWIEALDSKVNKLEKSSFNTTKRDLDEYEEAIAHYVSKYLMLNIHNFSKALGLSLAGLSEDQIKKCYDFLRSKVGHIFYKSPYGSRAFNKPRGYAGDFEMMNNVYFNELRGDNLFSKCVQRFFTDNPAGKAVRNRALYLNQKINQSLCQNKKSKILGVASGPAREIQKFFADDPAGAARCEIHLLDQDTEALKFSQKEIFDISRSKGVKPNVHFHNLAIKNIITEGLPFDNFDLIYSSGLFDYFTDPVAQFAAKQLYKGLAEKGELVIGNFGSNNPAQFVMEALGDWYLIYRDEKKLTDLYNVITSKLTIESESEGINLFAILKK